MRKQIFFASVSFLLFLGFFSLPAYAEFYIGVQGGLSYEKPSLGKIEFNKDSSFLYGAQIGLRFLFLGIEGQYYRANHSLKSDDILLADFNGRGLDYAFLGINVKIGAPLLIIYPYLSVAYGSYSAKIEDFGDNSERGYNVGAGVELTLGKISLFAEGKYIDFGLDVKERKFDFGGFNLHFGLNFNF